jgi:hypothetical protein
LPGAGIGGSRFDHLEGVAEKEGPMDETSTETLSVVLEREMPYPPEKIWRALTQPHLIEQWLMKNDFKPSWATVSIFVQTGASSAVRSWQSSRTERCLTLGLPMASKVSSGGL